jgi:hypothetical protein
MGIEEEVQKLKAYKTVNKIIAENFPNLQKDMVIQIQEAFRTWKRPKRNLSYE